MNWSAFWAYVILLTVFAVVVWACILVFGKGDG